MNARIAVFTGAKGGSGTTTVLADLTRAIARDARIAAVDGDLTGRRSLAVLLDAIRPLDAARLESKLPTVNLGSIAVAELVDNFDKSFTLQSDDVEALLRSLGENPTILVDAPQLFPAAVRPFIARAARYLIVVEPTLLGTTGARALIADCVRFGISRSRIALVVNSRDAGETTAAELGRLLDVPIFAELPSKRDRTYKRAIEILAERICALAPETEMRPPLFEAPIPNRRVHPRPDAREAPPEPPPKPKFDEPGGTDEVDSWAQLKGEVHAALAKQIDAAISSPAHSDARKLAELRAKVSEIAQSVLAGRSDLISVEQMATLREEVVDEALGLGPLEGLLRHADISEIMVNGPERIFVERAGKIELTGKRFANAQQLRLVIERIIAPLGRRIDESVPMVDARLPDGSRVNAIIEPLALDGPTVTIRRFGVRRLDVEDLLRLGAVTEPVVDLLRASVQGRLNIVVSGGTGSGKTTFLNILSGFIPSAERIVTIEDAAELKLNQTHVVRLEARPPNIEGAGEIRIRDLVRNSLRMRPDRIIVGECRGGEALDMLQAMNTGHDGSLTTVHANSPRDALARIETMVMMAGFDLPVRAIREQVAGAVDIIIQTARLRDGSRKVTAISEIVGMEGDVVTMQDIVTFQQRGLDAQNGVLGEFQYSGVQPNCLRRFEEMGIAFDARSLSKLPSAAGLW